MFAYARPTSLAEAFALFSDEPASRALGGGTDLLVGLRKRTVTAPLVVDLKRVTDLERGIDARGDELWIGALATMTDVARHPITRERFPALVSAANVVGSIQIRNRATLAGNLCNASPAADTAPPLLVAGARVELVGPAGRRAMPLRDFLLGPRRTALTAAELVAAVVLPLRAEPVGSAFGRITRRRGVDLATVNLACSVDRAGEVRFAYGAVGPRPFLAVEPSGELARETDAAELDRRLRVLAADARPVSNVRASREYRDAMLLVLSRRTLAQAKRALEVAGRA
ncbi:MAG TPA: xanthine dehydrogenase family protein subunit M [Candidatus Limnocylindria bacterium]|nr:xanthine dehydrogenase family protein subunit M [Candidatus Limnocylindria bacterium]